MRGQLHAVQDAFMKAHAMIHGMIEMARAKPSRIVEMLRGPISGIGGFGVVVSLGVLIYLVAGLLSDFHCLLAGSG